MTLPRGTTDHATLAQLIEQLICNLQVLGLSPRGGFGRDDPPVTWGVYPSGQRTGIVNPLTLVFGGSNPPAPIDPRGSPAEPTTDCLGVYPSGQRGQTVNLLAMPSEVRILPRPFHQPIPMTVDPLRTTVFFWTQAGDRVVAVCRRCSCIVWVGVCRITQFRALRRRPITRTDCMLVGLG